MLADNCSNGQTRGDDDDLFRPLAAGEDGAAINSCRARVVAVDVEGMMW